MRNKVLSPPIRIALAYLIIGGLWILFSDNFIESLNLKESFHLPLQTYKGWFFVTVTALLLYFYIRKLFNLLRKENEELKITKSEFAKEKKLLKSITETSPIGIMVSDTNGKIFFANTFAENLLQLENDEITERTYNDPKWEITYFNGDYLPEDEMPFRKVMNTGKSFFGIEHKILLPDGSKIFLHVNASPIIEKSGDISGVVSTLVDVTENISSAQKLRESEELLENFFTSSMDGFYISLLDFPIRWDEKSNKDKLLDYIFSHERIVKVNDALVEQYNSKKEEMIGMVPIKSFKHDIEEGKRGWFNLYEKGQTRVVTEEMKMDGSTMWVEGTYKLLYDAKKYIRGHFGIQRDITNRVKFEKELIDARNKAEQSEKLKSEFLAQMSHEIRTPLNIVISSSEYIKNELYEKSDDDLRTLFYGIQSAGKRLIVTIDQILQMSEIQSSTYDFNPRNLDLMKDVVNQIVDQFKSLALSKGLEFDVENKLTESRIIADKDSVEQIIYNLIDNAIKYTSAGTVKVILENLSGKKSISVKDTGIGISDQFISKLFDPFTQEEQGYTRKYEGNGLGLALVKRYCELNNAEITVESKKGVGSTFKVVF